MKKILFSLVTVFAFLNSGVSKNIASEKVIARCHIRVWWHNSTGHYVSDVYINAPSGSDCYAIAAGLSSQ